MAKSNTISLPGDNGKTYIGDNMTVKNYAPPTEKDAPLRVNLDTDLVSNCYEPVHDYRPRNKLDEEIKNIQKGKPNILHGTIGTGKTSAALRYILLKKQKFAISWVIDVSAGNDSIKKSLTDDLAEKPGISYDKLFHTIEKKSENEDVIFLLDNVETNPSNCDWFKRLWNIRHSVYIIITTNNPSLVLPDAKQIQVDKFDEALEFLRDDIQVENSEEDLIELCDLFGWNILGLTAAKHYMSTKKMSARKYLRMLRDKVAAQEVRENELRHCNQILYAGVRACLEAVNSDKFRAIAGIALISDKMIPDFLLSNLLSSNNRPANASNLQANEAVLNSLHDELKSLVCITNENGIRFFSFHSFTRYVIRDMIDESLKAALLHQLAGIFMKYISKDNRFSKGDFLQRTVREHAEIFLREWKNKQKDDRTLIALARLSELVGFTYTQQQPRLQDKLDVYFISARDLLHKLCGITDDDLQPNGGGGGLRDLFGLFRRHSLKDSTSDREHGDIYGITQRDSAVGRQLFTKLAKKSSKLSPDIIEELVFLRTVSKQDFALFPKVVKENQTVKDTIELSHPLSRSDVNVLVHHRVAYSVGHYRKLFLPELYLSVIYSFGRNYFYKNRASTTENLSIYIDLLKVAYCLSREISKEMNENEHVLHEYTVQANGLLYLLVNDDCISEDGTCKKKNVKVHAKNLENAIDRYRQLIGDKRTFFEMGILKKTKDDTYGKLVCYQQILKCYKNLLSLENIDRHQYIKDGVQLCDELLKLLDEIASEDIGGKKEDLVSYCRYMNAIAEFYIFLNQEKYYSQAIKIFAMSAEHAERNDKTYLEALVGLADIFSRIGKHRFSATQVSIRHLKQCNSEEHFLEMQKQMPHIKKRICNIQKQNVVMFLKHCILLPRRHEREKMSQCYVDESDTCEVDTLDSASSCTSSAKGEICDDDLSHENDPTHGNVLSQDSDPTHGNVPSKDSDPSHGIVLSQENDTTHSNLPSQGNNPTHGNGLSQDNDPTHGNVPSKDSDPTHAIVLSQDNDTTHSNLPSQGNNPTHGNGLSQDNDPTHGNVPSKDSDPTHGNVLSQDNDTTHGNLPSQGNNPTHGNVPSQDNDSTRGNIPSQNNDSTYVKVERNVVNVPCEEVSNETFQHQSTSVLHDNSSLHQRTNQDQMNAKTEDRKREEYNIDNHLMKLAKEIPEKWKELAKFLGISDSKIKETYLNHPGEVVWQAYVMLKHWWTSHHSAQSWREQLNKALCEIGRRDLAQDFAGDAL